MKTIRVLVLLVLAFGIVAVADAVGLSPLGEASAAGIEPACSFCAPPFNWPCPWDAVSH